MAMASAEPGQKTPYVIPQGRPMRMVKQQRHGARRAAEAKKRSRA